MKIVITGVAGFIGSTLAEKMIREHHEVYGIDCLNSYYDKSIKENNIALLLNHPAFHFFKEDITLISSGLNDIIKKADIIFHLAGQPGVRSSWGNGFGSYIKDNVETTQFLLEQVKQSQSLKKFILASSSSVYGNFSGIPMKEDIVPVPSSPYGITKLTAENLCSTYSSIYGINVLCLRYFSVYGPRQRPDMAFHRFLRAAILGEKITIFGDGKQTRDFTFVDDIVAGTLKAAFADIPKKFIIINIGSGMRISLREVIGLIEEITGKNILSDYAETEKGDMSDTFADISFAGQLLSYKPSISIRDGLKVQYRWMKLFSDILFGNAKKTENKNLIIN